MRHLDFLKDTGYADKSGRLTADGMWYTCLYQDEGLDLKTPLRDGVGEDDLAALVRAAWTRRADRGAELRLARIGRGPLYPAESLRAHPHREMHTRGG